MLMKNLPFAFILLIIGTGGGGLVDASTEIKKDDDVFDDTMMMMMMSNNNPTTTTTNGAFSGALQKAQELQVPQVTLSSQGETENIEFWENNEDILKQAWKEWSTSLESSSSSAASLLPSLNEMDIINTTIYNRIHEIFEQPSKNLEDSLKEDFLDEPIQGVYTIKNFISPTGIKEIRKHLSLVSQTNIPTRRPNGMNRFGIVIDDETPGGVWYPSLGSNFRTWLVDTYVRPLGRMLFPEYIGSNSDDSTAYAFTIQYSSDHDISLKEHSDASVFTMNINLNDPYNNDDDDEGYEGSSLMFRSSDDADDDDGSDKSELLLQEVILEPGMAVIHRGLHRHQALPISKGHRLQLVIWVFGDYGYVRFAPYPQSEQLSIEQRWTKKSTNKSKSSSSSSNKNNNPTASTTTTNDDDDDDDKNSGGSSSSKASLIQDACWNLQAYD